MISAFGVQVIATFEQFRPSVYVDQAGNPTIGYGHLIRRGEHFSQLTVQQAKELLMKDTEEAHLGAKRNVNAWPLLDWYQQDALISWVFNLGEGNLKSSTMLKVINTPYTQERDQEVARQMIRWVLANGERSRGLVRRRHCEAVWWLGAPRSVVMSLAKGVWT